MRFKKLKPNVKTTLLYTGATILFVTTGLLYFPLSCFQNFQIGGGQKHIGDGDNVRELRIPRITEKRMRWAPDLYESCDEIEKSDDNLRAAGCYLRMALSLHEYYSGAEQSDEYLLARLKCSVTAMKARLKCRDARDREQLAYFLEMYSHETRWMRSKGDSQEN